MPQEMKINPPTTLDVGAIATAIATCVYSSFSFIRWYIPRRRKAKEAEQIARGVGDIQVCYDIMKDMRDSGMCERVVHFTAHNDGGYPRPGCKFFVNAVRWVTPSREQDRMVEAYKEISVDSEYCTMVANIIAHGHVVLDVAMMPDCLLREIYRSEDVKYSALFFIGFYQKQVQYISCARYSKMDRPFTMMEITRLKLQAHLISNELNKEHR
jgi:hypothetical protein